jgi:hypothetical protein
MSENPMDLSPNVRHTQGLSDGGEFVGVILKNCR